MVIADEVLGVPVSPSHPGKSSPREGRTPSIVGTVPSIHPDLTVGLGQPTLTSSLSAASHEIAVTPSGIGPGSVGSEGTLHS